MRPLIFSFSYVHFLSYNADVMRPNIHAKHYLNLQN